MADTELNNSKGWHHLTNEELEAVFESDTVNGLPENEAAKRHRRAENDLWEINSASVKKYSLNSLFDFATLLLVLTVIVAAIFGGGHTALVIALMLLSCRAARVLVYIYSQRKFETLAKTAIPRAKVVRAGNVSLVPATEIAPGDVIILDAGDTVPCDIRLTAADSVLVAEKNVTDNDGIIAKNSKPINFTRMDVPVSMRTNMLYAMSTVVGGFGIGIAVATGRDTLFYARDGKTVLNEDTDTIPVLEKLSDWSRVCSLSLVIAAAILTVAGVSFGKVPLYEAFLPSVAMASACLSEYIGVIGSLAIAVSMKQKAGSSDGKKEKAGVLRFRMPEKAESAAAADVIFLRSPEVLRSRKITLHSYYKNSSLTMMGTKGAGAPEDLLSLAVYCTGMNPGGSIAAGVSGSGERNAAVMPYSVLRSLYNDNIVKRGRKSRDKYTVVSHRSAGDAGADGFDSVLLAGEGGLFFAMTGRADRVLSRCTVYKKDGEIVPLDVDEKKKILSYVAALKKRGIIINALAKKRSVYTDLSKISLLQNMMCFEGFIASSDRAEEDATGYITKLREDGTSVVIFSDGSDDDKYFCMAEGIIDTSDTYLDVKTASGTPSFSYDAGSITVICTPEGIGGIKERARFVRLAKEDGKKCAYVGYGVGDMWCMKEADVSVAVPAPGEKTVPQSLVGASSAVAQSSSGGFSDSMQIIMKCRHALKNLRCAMKYLISSHMARLFLLIFSAVSGILPFITAPQLVFWGLIVDFITSFAIVCAPMGKKDEYIKRKSADAPDGARDVLFPTLYGVLCSALSVASMFVGRAVIMSLGREYSLSDGIIVNCVFCACILAMPFIAAEEAGGYGLFSGRSRYGKFFILPFVAVGAGIVFSLFFSAGGTGFPGWLMCAFLFIPTLITVVILSLFRAITDKREKR